jgi:hypothetical protein
MTHCEKFGIGPEFNAATCSAAASAATLHALHSCCESCVFHTLCRPLPCLPAAVVHAHVPAALCRASCALSCVGLMPNMCSMAGSLPANMDSIWVGGGR